MGTYSLDPSGDGYDPNSSMVVRNSTSQRLRGPQPLISPSTHINSPSDSGYSSGPYTPSTPDQLIKAPRYEERYLGLDFDGNQSDLDDSIVEGLSESDDPFSDSATGSVSDGSDSSFFSVSQQAPSKAATLPARSTRIRPPLPPTFLSEPGSRVTRRVINTPLARGNVSSLRLLDRFVPARPQSGAGDSMERFRTGKAPFELSPTERILRHNEGARDVFCFRPRTVTPMAPDYRTRIRSRSDGPASRNRVGNVLTSLDQNRGGVTERQVSIGTIWAVGGVAPGGTAIDNGRGQLIASGTNAQLFRSTFPAAKLKDQEDLEKHSERIATALGLDRAQRVLGVPVHQHVDEALHRRRSIPTRWNGTEWVREGSAAKPRKSHECRTLPTSPFKVLDAPNMRDDFYCSVLAYSPPTHTLAVGLGDLLYTWRDGGGVKLLYPGAGSSTVSNREFYITSVAFSSTDGENCILAFGRSNGTLGLISLYDDPDPERSLVPPKPRFDLPQGSAVACLSWKPTCTIRPSKSPQTPGVPVKTEDLLLGDEWGRLFYYSVEWPARWEVKRRGWGGQVTLLARIEVHSQQICGLAWSPDGSLFASGGNDNLCCLFETSKVLGGGRRPRNGGAHAQPEWNWGPDVSEECRLKAMRAWERDFNFTPHQLGPGDEKYHWMHGAAVKAIAFCPWQEGLVATGGGTNDKCIHFFHTTSGAVLATISVSAQVTSLIWSTTRREIAATFGYAAPEHAVRIAVFAWPECHQVAAIPWPGENRALYAIPYPLGPGEARKSKKKDKARSRSRTAIEGCIVVAASDMTIKFHEVWAADKKTTTGGVGILGGSDILEGLEGIDMEGEVIR